MGDVGLFERCDFFFREADGERCDGVVEMMRLAGSHNRRSHGRLRQQPRKGDLGAGKGALLRNLSETIDNLVVGFFGV